MTTRLVRVRPVPIRTNISKLRTASTRRSSVRTGLSKGTVATATSANLHTEPSSSYHVLPHRAINLSKLPQQTVPRHLWCLRVKWCWMRRCSKWQALLRTLKSTKLRTVGCSTKNYSAHTGLAVCLDMSSAPLKRSTVITISVIWQLSNCALIQFWLPMPKISLLRTCLWKDFLFSMRSWSSRTLKLTLKSRVIRITRKLCWLHTTAARTTWARFGLTHLKLKTLVLNLTHPKALQIKIGQSSLLPILLSSLMMSECTQVSFSIKKRVGSVSSQFTTGIRAKCYRSETVKALLKSHQIQEGFIY